MAEIVVSIAAKVLEYLVETTIQQGRYLFCVHKIIKNLENEKEKLTLTKENVQNRVKEAKKKTEKIENEVENWINQVTNRMAEAEDLLQEINENNSCCQGWNRPWRRYSLCRQIARMTKTVMKLNNNSKFEKFSRLAPLPGISSRNFIYFESTELAYNQLLAAIRDDDIYMIGLYGMGGCGKTTLAREVGKKTKEMNLFDHVTFTTVSQTLNVRKIQGEIADLLGLKLEEESEVGRAGRISLKLRSGERILVILDDVWARLNLEDIGIPFIEDRGACKVLITTRRQQVCSLMECQTKIPLYLLTDEEALDLLQKHAKIDDVSSSSLLNELAWGVVGECKGLPLAIEVVGTSLRGKSIDELKIAVDRLKHSKPIDIEKGVRDIFACLPLSYDYLGDELAKSLLLMCSLFPDDHEILIEDLFRYGMGIGLCGEVDSFDNARSQVNASIKKLIESCLLMHPQATLYRVKIGNVVSDIDIFRSDVEFELVSWYEERTDRVKMHDMVHDVALWIASQEGQAMMVDPVRRDLKAKATGCFAISLWIKKIHRFPDPIVTPKLEILLLDTEFDDSLKLVNGFFEGIEGLRVMTMENERIWPLLSLPQATHLLSNLRTLRLRGWRLDDISFVVSLRKLEILDLSESVLKELPSGIEDLSSLKLLDLSDCTIGEDCYQVIARCSQLEELYALGSDLYYRGVDSYVCIPNDAAFPKLKRYSLEIGGNKQIDGSFNFPDCSRVLFIFDFNTSAFDATIKDLIQRSEFVGLTGLKECCNNLIPELVQAIGGLNELTLLRVADCSGIGCLINTTSYQAISTRENALPKLDTLTLSRMDNMKDVCHGPTPLSFFEKLKTLFLRDCHALQSVFAEDCKLSNLKTLSIYSCAMLTSLFPTPVA